MRDYVSCSHRVAQQRGNSLADRCACSSFAEDAQGFGAGLYKHLRQAGGLPAFQEESSVRQLPLSRSEANQARSGPQPPVPTQTGLAALPQQPQRARHGEERHREPVVRQVVRKHPG